MELSSEPQGFVYDPDTFVLDFEDPKYKGLVVEATTLSIGEVMGLLSITDGTQVRVEHAAKLVSSFSQALISWNILRKDGTPVPCSAEGLNSLDTRFVLPMVQAWFSAVMGVSGPLEIGSAAGESAPVESIPMAPL
jgi:hypothetical protein